MLIKCSECGEQISDKAQTCPHCGAPMEPTQQASGHTGKTAGPHRARGIVSFSAAAILLLDAVLYVAGRLVIAFLASRGGYESAWGLAFAERLLIVCAGTIPVLVLGCLLSWGVLQALHLSCARPSTRWILGCLTSLGIVATLVSAWIVWSDSSLLLPLSLFKEFRTEWPSGVIPGDLVPMSDMSDNWSLVPVLSAAFLACSLMVVAVRAVYVRLFERQ